MSATVGSLAPDFSLPATSGQPSTRREITLADYRGRWLTLMFYPKDFTFVCPTELTSVSGKLDEFQQRDCDVLGISTDSLETHEQWIHAPRAQGGLGGLRFPLASDADGAACSAYGVYLPRQHLALRGLFIIDPNGVLQYQVVQNLSVGRRTDELVRILDALQTGGLCPEGWSHGQQTIDIARSIGPGHVVSTYRIEARLGGGSFGSVYRATDTVLERPVALKLLHVEKKSAFEELLAEARAAAALSHPNVATIYAVDTSEGVPLIAMEYLEGQPLDTLLAAGALPAERARAIGRQIAAGLHAAHSRGIVHGDLKPANVMILGDGTAKILDFGLARRVPVGDSQSTIDWQPGETRGISGTPSYMSPEHARGESLVPASDVFALGLILFEMLSGKKAIAGSNILAALQRLELLEGSRLASGLPEPFAELISRAVVRDKARRSLTMAQIEQALIQE